MNVEAQREGGGSVDLYRFHHLPGVPDVVAVHHFVDLDEPQVSTMTRQAARALLGQLQGFGYTTRTETTFDGADVPSEPVGARDPGTRAMGLGIMLLPLGAACWWLILHGFGIV